MTIHQWSLVIDSCLLWLISPLRFGGRRRQDARFDDGLETSSGVAAVAKRLVLRMSAAAQGDCSAAGQVEFFSLSVFDDEIAGDAIRAVRVYNDLGVICH